MLKSCNLNATFPKGGVSSLYLWKFGANSTHRWFFFQINYCAYKHNSIINYLNRHRIYIWCCSFYSSPWQIWNLMMMLKPMPFFSVPQGGTWQPWKGMSFPCGRCILNGKYAFNWSTSKHFQHFCESNFYNSPIGQ